MAKRVPQIQDYGIIGNGRSAALVSRAGSIDWLCWPRFDSPSLFGHLLDSDVGGAWSIRPAKPASISRCYIDGTNVLETKFRVAAGTLILTDFMPVASEEQKQQRLWPEHELVRRLECVEGEAEVEVHFDPRPDYGRVKAIIRDAGSLGFRMQIGSCLLSLHTGVKLKQAAVGGLSARFTLAAGSKAWFSLAASWEAPAVLPASGEPLTEKLALTIDWWRRWAERVEYGGPFREHVVRSALTLKLLIYAPSGAVIAAPTTSLPERIGGDLNWDYRFCWLRDAAFTVRALFGLGFREDAEAFVSWMLHSTRLSRPELRVLYDIFGNPSLDETELSHLRGYQNSSPVRIGNAADNQLQLDVYGEVLEAVAHLLRRGCKLDGETQTMIRQFGGFVCRHWQQPDNGIWEPRDQREHFTHSRLMCWVALDRLIEMSPQIGQLTLDDLVRNRELIRRNIEDQGWNADLQSYTQVCGGHTLDATALLLALHEFHDARSSRMQKTYEKLQERLGAGPGLIYRHEKSIEHGEGTFAICSFWLADFLAMGGGSLDAAEESFAHTLSRANDLGLYAEEIDPSTGDALGNFPQAFTHVGLINAALSLEARQQSGWDSGRGSSSGSNGEGTGIFRSEDPS